MNTWSSKLKKRSTKCKEQIFLGGLFDCFDDCDVCCYGWCCTPCLYGENAEKIDGSSCYGSCFIWWLLYEWDLCCLVHMGKREALRNRFGLQEDCNDCVATTFCASCAICQEARELKFRLGSSEGICTYKDFIYCSIYTPCF
jgi:Cys-rich protein (TIGR01571 family)